MIEESAEVLQIILAAGPRQQDLEAMTDQELQAAFERLSSEIETVRDRSPLLVGSARLEWEITLLGARYQRESIQFERLARSMTHLEQCWTAARARQETSSLEHAALANHEQRSGWQD